MANFPGYDAGGPGRARESRSRALLALIVALVAGLGAAWLVTRALSRRTQTVVSVRMKKVVVGKEQIGLAQHLTKDQLEVREWPETAVPATAAQDVETLVGRVTRTEFLAGEPI